MTLFPGERQRCWKYPLPSPDDALVLWGEARTHINALYIFGSYNAPLLLVYSYLSLSNTSYVCTSLICSYSPDRSFVLEHGIFLVRNYEKMRERQALLLREEVTEREEENKEDRGSSQKEDQKGDLEDTSTKSGPAVCIAVKCVCVVRIVFSY